MAAAPARYLRGSGGGVLDDQQQRTSRGGGRRGGVSSAAPATTADQLQWRSDSGGCGVDDQASAAATRKPRCTA
ncbi:hypothetical protein Scep_010298 [Stephania cephalantha]|uniref:Uncharacterized protein n=1 Tax=Stephania cephalantha TaxID=152367 RepID=A0AAP0PDZ2_9MAGN